MVFRYFQKDSTHAFQTFPLRYTTPKDACFVQIQVVALRKMLAQPVRVDVDDVR